MTEAAPELGRTKAMPLRTSNVSSEPAIFDLYKLAVEMADRVSARRATANSFFLAAHAALTALVGVLHPAVSVSAAAQAKPFPFASVLLALAGVTLAVAWWLSLRSYRDLNRAKFDVITSLEKHLPVQLFDHEWRLLKRDPVRMWRGRYAELGQVEQLVPVVFILLYVGALGLLLLGL